MKPPATVTPLRPPLRLLKPRQAAAHTAPVQTPEPEPMHPDQRMADAVRAAWWSGHDMAERRYYMAGWRAGIRTGLFCAVAAGVAGLAAGLGAFDTVTSILAAATQWLATWGQA